MCSPLGDLNIRQGQTCLETAPAGAQLVARPEEHVDMLQGADADLAQEADRAHFYAQSASRCVAMAGWLSSLELPMNMTYAPGSMPIRLIVQS